MQTSILNTIKHMLAVTVEETAFDVDIVVGINSAMMFLSQIGVGPDGFVISDADDNWSDLLGDATNLESVKSYVYLKTRLLFDPPATSFVLSAMQTQIAELEWRLAIQAEGSPPNVP